MGSIFVWDPWERTVLKVNRVIKDTFIKELQENDFFIVIFLRFLCKFCVGSAVAQL